MNQTIFLNQQPIKPDTAQLIQSGGEGMVFRWQNTAVKLYHHPTAQHQAKLAYWFQNGLGQVVPAAVLAPCAPVTDSHGELVGFQMPLLPPGSQPLKGLSNPLFRQKNNIPLAAIVGLLAQLHVTLTHLHQHHILIGDLNDTNIYFTPAKPGEAGGTKASGYSRKGFPPASPLHPSDLTPASPRPSPAHPGAPAALTCSLIDADSYQFAHFPCPVAMPAFLDPDLYGVADLGARPYFTPRTDWYAFAVLLVKTLLGVHPYGGVHPQHKTVTARAQARVSIWQPSVTRPANSLPLDTLSDACQHYLQRVFEQGERPPFPATLLANVLRTAASQKRAAGSPTTVGRMRVLLADEGFIEHVALLPNGRVVAILHNGQNYKLVRLGIGGKWEEMALFDGSPGYQFAHFGGRFLAVNPPQRSQLLLLDVGGSSPQKVGLIDTAVFRDTAVFAATPQHLYRIAGNWIMRGQMLNGHYVEDAMATAHKNQTWFQASPYNDAIAGYHRVFAEYRFFVQTGAGSYDLPLPPLPAGDHIAQAGMAFGTDTVAVIVQAIGRGAVRMLTHVFSFTGQQQHSVEAGEDVWDTAGWATAVATYPITPLPADYTPPARLMRLGQQMLIQEPTRLLITPAS
jgi:serine/threonine protein kinase